MIDDVQSHAVLQQLASAEEMFELLSEPPGEPDLAVSKQWCLLQLQTWANPNEFVLAAHIGYVCGTNAAR